MTAKISLRIIKRERERERVATYKGQHLENDTKLKNNRKTEKDIDLGKT